MSKYSRYVVVDSNGEFAQSYSTQLDVALKPNSSETSAKWCAYITQGTMFGEYELNGEIKHKKIWDYKETQVKKYGK